MEGFQDDLLSSSLAHYVTLFFLLRLPPGMPHTLRKVYYYGFTYLSLRLFCILCFTEDFT